MSMSDKVKALLALSGKKQTELAEFCGCSLAFILPDGQQMVLKHEEKAPD